MIVLMIALGAAVGAPARYLTDRAVTAHNRSNFPWGTFVVNVAASLVFGLVLGAGSDLSERVIALLTTGFCGALSTFSTFSYETVRLIQERERGFAAAGVLASVLAGLGAVVLGMAAGKYL